MTDAPRGSGSRWWRRVALVAVALPGLGVVAAAANDQIHVHRLRKGVHSPNADERIDALRMIAQQRQQRLADAVCDVVAAEQDRAVLEAAAHAAYRIRDRRGVEVLQHRVDEGPDDELRARMIGYAASVSDRDARLMDWLEAGIQSSEPWRRAGSAAGLLVLGRPAGGQNLIEMAPDLPPEVRAYAIGELERIAELMAQAVGRRLDWSGADEGNLSDAQWAELGAFWQQYATMTLLNDVLDRIERRDPKWFEVDRLLHARERFAAWFEQEGD